MNTYLIGKYIHNAHESNTLDIFNESVYVINEFIVMIHDSPLIV